jgi:uncharacterized protein YecE (DUF72 family)
MSELRIGISGWRYAGWRGKFYPEDLAQRRELEFASRKFNSIEINGPFYSLQRPACYEAWFAQTPDDFLFSVKGPRFITHMKKLKDIDAPLANFFASGVFALREKLGPILWQFPPGFGFNPDRFEQFFTKLPRTTEEALEIARGFDNKLRFKPLLEIDRSRRLRHVVEARHSTFFCAEFVALLRKYRVGLVLADTAQKWPYAEDVTSDLVYIRLHGAEELYASGYSDAALDWWTTRIRAWQRGSQPADARLVSTKAPPRAKERHVHVYFDNDAKVHAPFDAARLAARLRSQ